MSIFTIFPVYLVWHYSKALGDLKRVSDNALWFVFNLFSIEILLKTIFDPWRRLSKDEASHHPTFFSNLVINIVMRISGFFIRLFTILAGVVSFVFLCAFFMLVFLVWLVLPALVPAMILYGLSYLI